MGRRTDRLDGGEPSLSDFQKLHTGVPMIGVHVKRKLLETWRLGLKTLLMGISTELELMP